MIDAQTLPWIVLGAGTALFILIFLRAFLTWIGGTWYEQKDPESPIQEIKLRQIGPLVWGSAQVPGGELHYRGWFSGSTLKMRRRDFGREYFSAMNFPKEVIRDLDGSEMAKMKFTWIPQKSQLQGEHYPQKIEISRTRPPRILERGYLPPTPRTWHRSPKAFQSNSASPTNESPLP